MKMLWLVPLFFCIPSYAEVYQCNGVYQSDPCSEDSQPVALKSGSVVDYHLPDQRIKNAVDVSTSNNNTMAQNNEQKHSCAGYKVDKDSIRFRQTTMCMTEGQLLKIAGPQQYSVYEYYKDGRHYKQYRFTEPRAGFPSAPLVEGGYVIDPGSSSNFVNH